jgi:hypothetical protein
MRIWIGDLKTGRNIISVPCVSSSWSRTVNKSDSVTVAVPLYAASDATEEYRRIVADARLLDLRNTATVGKTFLVAEDDGITAGGPLLARDYSAKDRTVTLTAAGMRAYFGSRVILPPTAASKPLVDSGGAPDTSLDTTITGVSWRTIDKRIVAQAVAWPESVQCITFEDDVAGDNQITYKAVDLDAIGTVLDNNAARLNGCDYDFLPRRTNDRRGFEWLLRTGSPRLNVDVTHSFDNTSSRRPLLDLENSEAGDGLATRAWVTGGKGDETVLVGTAVNSTFTDAGAPMWEAVDTSHTSVSDQATLDSYASEAVRVGYQAVAGTPVKLHMSPPASLGQLDIGNMLRFKTRGEWMFADGWHVRRILGLSHSEGSSTVTLTLGSVYADSGEVADG